VRRSPLPTIAFLVSHGLRLSEVEDMSDDEIAAWSIVLREQMSGAEFDFASETWREK
jgi:hypothetical protein